MDSMKVIIILFALAEIVGFCLFAYYLFWHGPHTRQQTGSNRPPIKGSQIIEDNHLANAIRNAKELKKVYEDLNHEVEKLKKSTKELGKSE
jgi:hypothetical protein